MHIFNREIEKDVFVGFYGHFENDKRLSIAKSILLNPNLKNSASFRGTGWKNKLIKYKKDSNFSRVIGKEYVNQINKTWISLGIYSTLNRDNYSRRTFEIPMCGSVLMSEKNEFITRNFIEDREALFFFSKEDLIEKLIYYQSNKHKLKEIANNGKKKIISLNGSIHDRAFEILKNL